MVELLDGLRPDVRKTIEAKGLLKDPKNEIALRSMTPESRKQVLHQIGALEVPWDTAIGVGEYEEAPRDSQDGGPQNEDPYGLRQEWRLDALRPHPLNGKIYGLSLGEERIKALAKDIKEKGLRVPIEILADGTILDGHSRYLALLLLVVEMVPVVVVADSMTETEILRYIIDANKSQRRMSVREQVMVFQAEMELAKLADPQNEDLKPVINMEPHEGEPDPQNEDLEIPSNDPQNEALLLSPQALRNELARRAGFRSYETARRARKVFAEGDESIRDQLDRGLISVNKAFGSLSAPQDQGISRYDHETAEPCENDTSHPDPAAAPPSTDRTNHAESVSQPDPHGLREDAADEDSEENLPPPMQPNDAVKVLGDYLERVTVKDPDVGDRKLRLILKNLARRVRMAKKIAA